MWNLHTPLFTHVTPPFTHATPPFTLQAKISAASQYTLGSNDDEDETENTYTLGANDVDAENAPAQKLRKPAIENNYTLGNNDEDEVEIVPPTTSKLPAEFKVTTVYDLGHNNEMLSYGDINGANYDPSDASENDAYHAYMLSTVVKPAPKPLDKKKKPTKDRGYLETEWFL